MYPGRQRQVYVLASSIHVAPLTHVWFRQSLESVIQFVASSSQPIRCHNIANINDIERCRRCRYLHHYATLKVAAAMSKVLSTWLKLTRERALCNKVMIRLIPWCHISSLIDLVSDIIKGSVVSALLLLKCTLMTRFCYLHVVTKLRCYKVKLFAGDIELSVKI